MTNKERFIDWLYAVAIILGAAVSIITSVAVFNAAAGAVPTGFYIVMAVVNIILTVALAIFGWRKHFNK